jgi:hypothetical protein
MNEGTRRTQYSTEPVLYLAFELSKERCMLRQGARRAMSSSL